MKFNNRILRKILIRDNRAESSIVALYKKLELQSAMEILDTVSGDISAAPSVVCLSYEASITSLWRERHLRVVSTHQTSFLFLCVCPAVRTRRARLNRGRSSWLPISRACMRSCPRTCTRSGSG